MTRNVFIISVLLIFGTSSGFAQIRTLQEAEDHALANALQLQIAEKGVEKARIGFRDAVGNALPSISAYGQATTNQELPTLIMDFDGDPTTPPLVISMGSRYSNTAGFSLSQPLFTGGAVLAGYRIAKEGINLAQINERMTRETMIMTIRSLWYQYQLTGALLKATDQAVQSSTANLDLAEKKYNAGSASQFEVLQARVTLEQLKPSLIQLQNQLAIIEINLLTYINDPDVKQIEPEQDLTREDNPYAGMDLNEITDLALANRPELQLQQGQKRILEQQRNIAYGQTLPMVSFSADIRHQAQNDDKANLEYYRSKSTSINLSIPLFSGGRKLASIQQARVALKEADLQYEQTLKFIKTEVESMYQKVSETEQSIEANASFVEQAKEAHRLAKLMYENGSSTQLDVQNAQSAVLQATAAYLSSVFQYNLAVNQLKKSLNQL